MKKKDQRGIVAIVVVMIVSAMTVIFGLSVALMTVDEMNASQASLFRPKAQYQSTACVHNMLALLRNNSSLSGNVNIALANVNCIASISGSGNTRVIVSNATTTDAFGRSIAERVNVNVNINTNPFTIAEYKDILE